MDSNQLAYQNAADLDLHCFKNRMKLGLAGFKRSVGLIFFFIYLYVFETYPSESDDNAEILSQARDLFSQDLILLACAMKLAVQISL